MPELPEVEVVRRDLAAEVAGSTVVEASVTGARSVRRQEPEQLVRQVTGAGLGTPGRVGKYLTIPLEGTEDEVLVVHLRMSGRLVLAGAGDPLALHTHAVLRLSDGRELRFVDPRTFGELFVSRCTGRAGGGRPPELVHLGPDPFDPSFSEAVLTQLVAGRRGRLKPLLMDQRRLAGLGNIYSDEALFQAGLRFDRPAGSLTPGEVSSLHAAITATLAEAVEHRGSSLRDAQYVDLFGRPGGYQSHHRVYAREGRPCLRCGRPVVRRRVGNRSTFLCEACQA